MSESKTQNIGGAVAGDGARESRASRESRDAAPDVNELTPRLRTLRARLGEFRGRL